MIIQTEKKIAAISRLLVIYGLFIFAGLLWNAADGGIENMHQFIRGVVRGIVMIYLARTIWQYKKVHWWMITGLSLVFSIVGLSAIVLLIMGGVMNDRMQYVTLAVITVPVIVLLLRVFYLSIQKDVRQQFVN